MKEVFLDTNVILRFLLKDDEGFFKKAKNIFQKAKNNELTVRVVPQVIFEINYVLEGVYSFSKNKRVDVIEKIVSTASLKIERRDILLKALELYGQCNVDLVDIYLYCLAGKKAGKVISFDKDFKKLRKLSS